VEKAAELQYNGFRQKMIKLPVFFGYFSMMFSGMLVNSFGYKDNEFNPRFWKPAIWISATFSFAGYVLLGQLTTYETPETDFWFYGS